MASSDMDPVFKRALRLLHSRSKNAEEQLRMMLDDAIKQRYGSDKTLTNYLNKKELSNKQGSPRKTSSGGRWKDLRDKDQLYEKLNEDGTSESSQESHGLKKKSDSEIIKSSHSRQLLMQSSITTAEELPLIGIRETDDHEEEDLALEILEDDLRCVICRGMDIGARNQMVECVECKSLYHQECHQPPVAHADINPRSTWYCGNCTEAISKRNASSNNSEKHMYGLNLAGATTLHSGDMKPTVATTVTKSLPSSSSSKSVGSISQGLAKPLSSSTSSSKSVESASSSSKLVTPNISIINAEKKIQIMKKKAAKQQEKRKHSN